MRWAAITIGTAVTCSLVLSATEAAAQARKTPYYASISAGKARMRTGPGRNYPASWLYVRSGLPIRVVGIYKEWRKVEDPGGEQGWMQANLLTETRTAIVVDTIVTLRATPGPTGHLQYRAEPGVIGRVGRCDAGWCRLDVKGRAGFVEAIHLWGVDAGEVLP